ncbi:phage holin family protein [Limnobaculum xujianqingii]|uniref:phage holin family protein n=1 Tax=Limnobaculum xujianqingii TaxID=2738837 RepID=UPI00112E07A0|nr:phage holin family protein [Limnobaculum xujianqingii]
MRMPEKYNGFFSALVAWYSANSGWINGGIIAFILALGRAVFYGGKIKESFVDAFLTGFVAVTSVPVISPIVVRIIELTPGMSGVLTKTSELNIELFIFAFIGVIGAKTLREVALSRLRKANDVGGKDE